MEVVISSGDTFNVKKDEGMSYCWVKLESPGGGYYAINFYVEKADIAKRDALYEAFKALFPESKSKFASEPVPQMVGDDSDIPF